MQNKKAQTGILVSMGAVPTLKLTGVSIKCHRIEDMIYNKTAHTLGITMFKDASGYPQLGPARYKFECFLVQ
jgi:hypothetical protein